MGKKTMRDAKIRIYDGAGTPLYLELDLDRGDFAGPLGTPRNEEILVLDRGSMTANAHYIKGADDKIMEAVPVTFGVFVRDETQWVNLKNLLRAGSNGGSTQVNSHTLATTKQDTQRNGANNNPAFADTNKLTFNVEYLVTMSGTDWGMKYSEVFFPLESEQLSEAEDGIPLAISGQCYGTITDITAFTAGTDMEV